MTKQKYDAIAALQRLGIEQEDAKALRRISMTLRAWYEHECNGNIQRAGEDGSGKPYWHSSGTGKRLYAVPDRERGAEKRLAAIMAKYSPLYAYLQTDPRGCALHILRPGDVPEGCDAGSYYSRGIAVY